MSTDMHNEPRFIARPALPDLVESPWFVLDLSMVPADSVAVCPTATKADDVRQGLELLEASREAVLADVYGAPV